MGHHQIYDDDLKKEYLINPSAEITTILLQGRALPPTPAELAAIEQLYKRANQRRRSSSRLFSWTGRIAGDCNSALTTREPQSSSENKTRGAQTVRLPRNSSRARTHPALSTPPEGWIQSHREITESYNTQLPKDKSKIIKNLLKHWGSEHKDTNLFDAQISTETGPEDENQTPILTTKNNMKTSVSSPGKNVKPVNNRTVRIVKFYTTYFEETRANEARMVS